MLLKWIELSGRPREARELLKWCYGRYTISLIIVTDASFTTLCVHSTSDEFITFLPCVIHNNLRLLAL